MTAAELVTYAEAVIAGGPVKKSEVLAFMKAFLASQDPDLQAGGPAMTKEEVVKAYLPPLPFEIMGSATGIHLPRECNRWFSKPEALALMAAIAKAIE